jgi:serine/threonine protein kinase
MGAVVLATDTRLDRKVAIKRILGEAAGNRLAVARFLTEAKAIAALNHPNIVQIYDYGRAKDGPFLIMEYVDGGSLADRCRQGPLPLDDAVDLACRLCDGLAKAHDAGIIHRDIKPANVLLTKDGTPKLTDFGLAKAESGDHGQTMTGAVLGTPDFMPPEQRRDASEVDQRSDLWSLAATVYQMASGRSPKVLRLHELPGSLRDVLGKALEDRKTDRYSTARDFKEALERGRIRDAQSSPVTDLASGQCRSCGATNDSTRKFCRQCAASLEQACLRCTAPSPVWEDVCGQCGSRQSAVIEDIRADTARRRAEVERLLDDMNFIEAEALALSASVPVHPLLAEERAWCDGVLGAIAERRQRQRVEVVAMLNEALAHEKAHDYPAAIHALERVPKAMYQEHGKDPKETVQAVMRRVVGIHQECQQLESWIRDAIRTKQFDGLKIKASRLQSLLPGRQDLAKLLGQIDSRDRARKERADRAIAIAHQHLQRGELEKAAESLNAIPKGMSEPEIVSLRNEIWKRKQQPEIRQKQKLAVDLLNAGQRDQALELLESIPKALRLPYTEELLQGIRKKGQSEQPADIVADSQDGSDWLRAWFFAFLSLFFIICGALALSKTIQESHEWGLDHYKMLGAVVFSVCYLVRFIAVRFRR